MMSDAVANPTVTLIARELQVRPSQVSAAIGLLDEGATVPFVARYRKEVTGGMSDTQLRALEQRLGYLRELERRRTAICDALTEQGVLTPALRQALIQADTKTRLEDLYAPYKARRRTKAQAAREAGLTPLAEQLRKGENLPERLAAGALAAGCQLSSVDEALEGAADILVDEIATDADLNAELREQLWQDGQLHARLIKAKQSEAAKYQDYFDHGEPIRRMPSHRALAVFRGQAEGVLRVTIRSSDEDRALLGRVAARANFPRRGPAAAWLAGVVDRAWRERLRVSVEKQLLTRLREAAEAESIEVFSKNLKQLLLAAPAGPKVTLGLDPGLRTGVKAAVVDSCGHLMATETLYPHPPKKQWDRGIEQLRQLCRRHQVELVAIGNGTASRETDQWVAELMSRHPELKLTRIVVSEAGASVYSASELAANELPALDVSLRGAVSIARRLQDPLAELVKIDPRSIGVGQYQHDVDQKELAASLDTVVEDCVNAVGVDLNTASEALLTRVAGLTPALAANIVAYREEQGAFVDRQQLHKVKRLGPKAFEQSAGFLRIRNGKNPLDASAVHPESYGLVERLAKHWQHPVAALIGNRLLLQQAEQSSLPKGEAGDYTLRDVLAELEKPGRDPRPEFRTARFDSRVDRPADLVPGMLLEGVVTNVASFGAFVDIGVHQDGLVHISQLADQFVRDPHQVVRPGQVVQVRVLEVELERSRISLSMRAPSSGSDKPAKNGGEYPRHSAGSPRPKPGAKPESQSEGNLAVQLRQAFGRAKKR